MLNIRFQSDASNPSRRPNWTGDGEEGVGAETALPASCPCRMTRKRPYHAAMHSSAGSIFMPLAGGILIFPLASRNIISKTRLGGR